MKLKLKINKCNIMKHVEYYANHTQCPDCGKELVK